MARFLLPVLVLSAPFTVGCTAEELPGVYYEVVLETAKDAEGALKDECNDPPEAEQQTYTYVVQAEGANAKIFIDGGLFATGALAGCDLSYQSPIWTEDREDGGSVRWSVRGDAVISLGEGCNAGDGWEGEERIDVVNSTSDSVPPGCSYWMSVSGAYVGEVL